MAVVKYDTERKQWAVDTFAADIVYFDHEDEAEGFADFINAGD